MSRTCRFAVVLAALLVATLPAMLAAQRRAVPRAHPPHPQHSVVVRGQVFVGGYFYDPYWGPYPWWPRAVYPYWYYPVYDTRSELRIRLEPDAAEEAAVYVDGFYAGIVDDFNGTFQSLHLTPGGHTVVVYLEGYRTIRHNIYMRPGSTYQLRQTMEKLPPDEKSEPPELAPPLPPPAAGTYRPPATPPRLPPPASTRPAEPQAAGFGTLDLFVQPATAAVTIDGQPWGTSDEGHFVLQLPLGRHQVEVGQAGYRPFVADIEIREGEIRPLNVSLIRGTS